MARELTVRFQDPGAYRQRRHAIEDRIAGLATFVRRQDDEYWSQGNERRGDAGRWEFDVRLFLEADHMQVEISARPASIEADLRTWLAWLRQTLAVSVQDEDGEPSTW